MPPAELTADTLLPHFERCGYTRPSRLAPDFAFNGRSVPLAGFFSLPWDTRTACLAAVNLDGDSEATARHCAPIGAPTVFVCGSSQIDVWRLTPSGPTDRRSLGPSEIDGFFERHSQDLSPRAIHDAKMMRLPVSRARQMQFVDIGLMPAVERQAGETLHRLVEGAIQDLTAALGKKLERSRSGFANLYKTVFWLLAAKLLHEKQVTNFIRLNLADVNHVFDRVARHYGSTDNLPPGGKAWRPAIDAVAKSISEWGHLGHVSTEALGYLYERALIDKRGRSGGKDIRKELGIHSTPPVLVDHILAQLWPLIEEIPVDQRYVLEPACGHGAFLVAALRWLRDYAEIDEGPDLHRYLRQRLHGIEIDPFARELAKLSLTLADVPHGNSWRIDEADMFAPGVLKTASATSTILLANPPYEPFTPQQRRQYERISGSVKATTKAAEMLRRTLPHLPPGAAFGLVVPRGTLHDVESRPIRELLLDAFQLTEVSILADNLFEEADHETAVLIGHRRLNDKGSHRVWYRRVRERGMGAFKERLQFSSERQLDLDRFGADQQRTLFLPDLLEVWDYLREAPTLGGIVRVHQGFQLKGKRDLGDRVVISDREKRGWQRAILRASEEYDIWRLPKSTWVRMTKDTLRRKGPPHGQPQVVVNYAPVSRDAWRLKAVIDEEGVAVSSRFLVFRPRIKGPSLRLLWAILNSPVANAYAYCVSGKQQTLPQEWNQFPLPHPSPHQQSAIESAAERYLKLIRHSPRLNVGEDALRQALYAMDAEVLRLYDLPPRLERQVLDLFDGIERKGVGCEFRGYYPPGMDAFVPLHELISEDFARSTLEHFSKAHPPAVPRDVLAALQQAAESYGEE